MDGSGQAARCCVFAVSEDCADHNGKQKQRLPGRCFTASTRLYMREIYGSDVKAGLAELDRAGFVAMECIC
jgi:hypothetical protein